ncbi:hypothetical protein, partial [Beijerinckia sp. L45]
MTRPSMTRARSTNDAPQAK